VAIIKIKDEYSKTPKKRQSRLNDSIYNDIFIDKNGNHKKTKKTKTSVMGAKAGEDKGSEVIYLEKG
jgi:hypothetical protein